jgi:hypothetical protein
MTSVFRIRDKLDSGAARLDPAWFGKVCPGRFQADFGASKTSRPMSS